MTLDDKLSILDIKGRDQQGRLYNLEMQMLLTAALAQRLLYYWSKVYSQQLAEGDDYMCLRPTISICFVNGDLFPGHPEYHTQFRLRDAAGQLCLTDDLAIHVLELPKFTRTLSELRTPLDSWLYFFKNGVGLDADALPEALDRPELRKAMMGVLKMLAQNDLERELYEGRLKARRDMQTLEALRDQSQQRFETADREREQARREVKRELAERISLCQRLLRRPDSDAGELLERSAEELRDQAERLERELTDRIGPT